MRMQMMSVGFEVKYVVLDSWGCPRYNFDLSPSGFTNKQVGCPSNSETVCIPISPIQVLMNPGLLTPEEIRFLNWPAALATTIGLLQA